jgi:uncharacterized membrane-anchored protein
MFDLLATSSLNVGGWQFLTILLLVFGLFLILAGIFTAYFGSGKSRTIGIALLVVGLVVGLATAFLYHDGTFNGGSSNQLGSLLWNSFLVIIAAVIGALVAVGIFLVAIMKS